MKPKILAAGHYSEAGVELLAKHCDVIRVLDIGQDELLTQLSRIRPDGLLCIWHNKITGPMLEASPDLKVVSSLSEIPTHVDTATATAHGIYVTSVPGGLADTVADFTWALILALSRRVSESAEIIRSGKWTGVHPIVATEVYGRTLGLIGLGRIGIEVARRAVGFKMRTLYYDVRRLDPEMERDIQVEFRDLDTLLRESDIVSIHAWLNDSSRGMLNKEKLALMKPTSLLINTARGPVINEDELISVLQAGGIAGAALDVYEKEPIDPANPLLKMTNVLPTPHVAGSTHQVEDKISLAAAGALLSTLQGRMPDGLANPDVVKIRPLDKVKLL